MSVQSDSSEERAHFDRNFRTDVFALLRGALSATLPKRCCEDRHQQLGYCRFQELPVTSESGFSSGRSFTMHSITLVQCLG